MIVVTVELIPFSNPERKEVLARAIIANDGTSTTQSRGNYDLFVGRKGQTLTQTLRSPQRRGRVTDWPRKSYSVWRLVCRAIKSAFPEEK